MQNTVNLLLGKDRKPPFIGAEFLPEGKNEYYLRDRQTTVPEGGWRHLKSQEIELLVKNNNTADSWDNLLVTDPFEPRRIKNNRFYGLVRIGAVSEGVLQYHDLQLRVGITNSQVTNCDIGNNCAIHNVLYMSNIIVGDRSILFDIEEISTTNHAKFGNGILKDGENPSVRVALEVMNETGCRRVYPFDGMIAADAYLMAKYIDDTRLQQRLALLTQNRFDSHRGYYGTIGQDTVIKGTGILKDVIIGDSCYIKGALKLKNLTINSSQDEPTQVGEGVVMVNGIVGYGCHIFYNVIAVRFVMGNNSNLKYGARLINTFLGDNSTISCCEVLNSLIFPAHEQHHNNSFLVAAVLMGQTNLAAGATLGSNHNSRTNDNEIQAGRGFWPGLCSSVKHSCRFASYTLLSKADYPTEMDIPLPFALVNNNVSKNELEVMPAFWWMYNMYALARNSWKYQQRDKRKHRLQHIEFDAYAPDSMEEVISARKLLEVWTAKAWWRAQGQDPEPMEYYELREKGYELLHGDAKTVDSLDVFGEHMEKGHRKVRILKVYRAYHAYGDMLLHYAASNIMQYLEKNPQASFASFTEMFHDKRQREWANLGGQLMQASDLEQLMDDIRNGVLDSWDAIHHRYDDIWTKYEFDKLHHAYLSLCFLLRCDPEQPIDRASWECVLSREEELQQYICDQVYESRKKDYENIFRRATYRNEAEMLAAVGPLEENGFILQTREQTAQAKERLAALRSRL